ncbi:SDR family NAD(P)-dependent oxidoreductase [Trinickia acidisoli]|uniref:SDR family NAD(P)-dependent oxidoreductase n=1 Tax=Trinickia acidisoli TaxID=2767482 RepID=UPI001A8F21B6|nr:SDR family oxidoreductase [Trinickia acidisoli]
MSSKRPRIAIFGASGAIGGALVAWFAQRGWDVLGIGRRAPNRVDAACGWAHVVWSPLDQPEPPAALAELDAVVWAQGDNCNDSIEDFDAARHQQMYEANVLFVLASLNALLRQKRVAADGARLCVVSSMWQNIARQNKLSYCITKSALQGLIRSASIDLAPAGHVINAVLPGALDTPMTRANLSAEQIQRLEAATPAGRLAGVDDVAAAVEFCCSTAHRAITGQFITVDKGFSYARIL